MFIIAPTTHTVFFLATERHLLLNIYPVKAYRKTPIHTSSCSCDDTTAMNHPDAIPEVFMKSQRNMTSDILNTTPPPLHQYRSVNDIRFLSCEITDGTPLWLLESFERQTATKSNALSYCWGNGVKQPPIVCNGHSIKVTSSVAGTFQMIAQSHTRNDAQVWMDEVWMDALCLNQEGEHEKAVHNAQMSQIYAEACQVILWLGGADSENDTIISVRQILPFLKSKIHH